jgi:NADH-quinone oxidoreductase subunit M
LKYCWNSITSVLLSFSLIGVIVFSFVVFILALYNLRLYDFKKIIALSSIVHLNFSLIAMFSLSLLAYYLLVLNSVAHGFSAMLLFLLFGYIISKSYTRFIDSLYFASSSLRIFIFTAFLINLSFPLSFNFISELLTFIVLASISLYLAILLSVPIGIITLFYFIIYNRFSPHSLNSIYLSFRESMYCSFLIFVNLFYGAYSLCSLSLYSILPIASLRSARKPRSSLQVPAYAALRLAYSLF